MAASGGLDEAERLMARAAWREAHGLCIAALKADPAEARAYFLLGVLAAEHGNLARAAELFERAAALAPDVARHHAHLARCLTGLNRQDEAREAAERAAALDPSDALTLDTIGVVHSRTGRHDLAIGFFERAAALEPDNASFLYNLGASRQFMGDFEAAADAYRAAIARSPGLYKAWSSLVQLARQTAPSPELEALFPEGDDDPDRALHIGHALAKTHEDLGDHPASLQWLLKAKAPKRAAVAYDPAHDAALFEAAAATAPGRAGGYAFDAPIFIVGLPRTGTTLVDRILSSHPDVVSAGELTNFALIAKRTADTPSALVLDPETLLAARDLDLAELGRAYIESVEPLRAGAPRFIDKMPLNVLYAGLIHRALPDARIVCLRRHPMDAALSNFRQLFATGFSYYNYALGLEDTARYVVLFERLAAHWRATLPPDRYTEVAYEDLVADQEGQTRRLLAFCGLEWDARCLAFHENAAPVATASSVQVRSPIYASSVGRWRRYGDGLQPMIDIFRAEGLLSD